MEERTETKGKATEDSEGGAILEEKKDTVHDSV